MLKYGPDKLDYFELTKSAKRLAPADPQSSVRVALLGDCALQQIRSLLDIQLRRSGVPAVIFEAPFDTIDPLVLDPTSDLYRFQPDFVVFCNATQRFRNELLLVGNGDKRQSLAERTVEAMIARWDAVAASSKATLLQTSFVMPLERPLGQFEHRRPSSLQSLFGAANRRLAEEAARRPSTFICDIDFVAASAGKTKWFDERLWTVAKTPCALDCLPHLVQSIVDVICACRGAAVKCVVLDLDNTLWGGVIGDDGLEGIRLGHLGEGEAFVAFQGFLKALSQRGILLAVCSKNEREAALLPFQRHAEMVLREQDIAVFVANWENKSDNLRAIARTLNIGLDTLVFVDDNPFERNLVRELCPEVIVPEMPEDPADYVKTLSAYNLFETTSYSELDDKRTQLYRERAESEALATSFRSVDEYLKSLDMVAHLGRFDAYHLPRIAQLLLRSNQFNLTTRRYSSAECEGFAADPSYYPFHVSLKDKLSDHGLISVAILRERPEAIHVDTFLMSCRVLKRGVEQLVVNTMVAHAKEKGKQRLTAEYIPTAKNAMVRDLYPTFGFEVTSRDEDGTTRYALDVERFTPFDVFIQLQPL